MVLKAGVLISTRYGATKCPGIQRHIYCPLFIHPGNILLTSPWNRLNAPVSCSCFSTGSVSAADLSIAPARLSAGFLAYNNAACSTGPGPQIVLTMSTMANCGLDVARSSGSGSSSHTGNGGLYGLASSRSCARLCCLLVTASNPLLVTGRRPPLLYPWLSRSLAPWFLSLPC